MCDPEDGPGSLSGSPAELFSPGSTAVALAFCPPSLGDEGGCAHLDFPLATVESFLLPVPWT